ncbi:MAG: uroporphyrinogen-III synthase [Gemmatimonadales bacterium]
MTLAGRGVVVTRTESEDGPLATKLAALGARVIRWPTTKSVPPADTTALDRALSQIAVYDWVVFSSARAVAPVVDRVCIPPPNVKVATVGRATADAVMDGGWPVHLTPGKFDAQSLVAEFARRNVDGVRVLFPCSSKARDTIPVGLTTLGARVDRVVAYETSYIALDGESCLRQIYSGDVDAITFTSPSAITGLVSSLGNEGFRTALERVPAIVIGPTTQRALNEAGSKPAAVANPSTLDGLVDSLTTFFEKEKR